MPSFLNNKQFFSRINSLVLMGSGVTLIALISYLLIFKQQQQTSGSIETTKQKKIKSKAAQRSGSSTAAKRSESTEAAADSASDSDDDEPPEQQQLNIRKRSTETAEKSYATVLAAVETVATKNNITNAKNEDNSNKNNKNKLDLNAEYNDDNNKSEKVVQNLQKKTAANVSGSEQSLSSTSFSNSSQLFDNDDDDEEEEEDQQRETDDSLAIIADNSKQQKRSLPVPQTPTSNEGGGGHHETNNSSTTDSGQEHSGVENEATTATTTMNQQHQLMTTSTTSMTWSEKLFKNEQLQKPPEKNEAQKPDDLADSEKNKQQQEKVGNEQQQQTARLSWSELFKNDQQQLQQQQQQQQPSEKDEAVVSAVSSKPDDSVPVKNQQQQQQQQLEKLDTTVVAVVDDKKPDDLADQEKNQQHEFEKADKAVVTTPKPDDSAADSEKNQQQQEQQQQTIDSITNTSANNAAISEIVVYEFHFPRKYCGKLIGRNGVNVDSIRTKTNTKIAIRNDLHQEELQIVCISGQLKDVDRALDIISARFPPHAYPNVSLKPISRPIIYRRYHPDIKSTTQGSKSAIQSPTDPLTSKTTSTAGTYNYSKVLVTQNMFVDFDTIFTMNPNSLSNYGNAYVFDIYVTAVINVAHVFIQLPTHPSYANQTTLDSNMVKVYKDASKMAPVMQEPIEPGTICAAPTIYGWHRAIVTSYEPPRSAADRQQAAANGDNETDSDYGTTTVKFLDYGGYLTLSANQLRQLRSDFMQLPFQSIECFLYDVNPILAMQDEGIALISNYAKETQLSASLEGYSDEGVPFIKIYRKNEENEIFCLNKEVVQLGYATKLMLEMTYAEAANNSFPTLDHLSQQNNVEEQPQQSTVSAMPASHVRRPAPANQRKVLNKTVSAVESNVHRGSVNENNESINNNEHQHQQQVKQITTPTKQHQHSTGKQFTRAINLQTK